MDHPPKDDELYQCPNPACCMAFVITVPCGMSEGSPMTDLMCCCGMPMKLIGNATDIAMGRQSPEKGK